MSLKRHMRRKRSGSGRDGQAATWPIGRGVQVVIELSSEPRDDDDCPICRALREAGEPVVRIDARRRDAN